MFLCFDISFLVFHADLGTCSHVVSFDLINKLQIAYVWNVMLCFMYVWKEIADF